MRNVTQHTSTINQPSSSQPPKKQKHRKTKKQNTKVSQPSDPTEPMADEIENVESVPTHFNDLLLSALEIDSLKRRVKKLERRNKSRTPGLKRLRKVGRSVRVVSSEDEGLSAQEDASKQGVFDEQEVEVEKVVSTAEVTTASATTTTIDELSLAQTLIEIKPAKPKVVTTAATTTTTAVIKPKARGVIPDYELAARLQAQEQEELTVEEKSKLFVELMDKRKKHFTRLRAEEQRRKPPTKPQKRNQMCTYLKNMVGFTHSQLKNKSFDEVQKAFDKTMGWIDSFVSMYYEVVKGGKEKDEGSVTRVEESSSKRADTELEQERIKKQKIDDDQEEVEMKKLMKIVVDEEIAVDAIPLATKPPIIVD
ncbi:hypothetical protein Tco_1275955 [Tanacetum coccineum]